MTLKIPMRTENPTCKAQIAQSIITLNGVFCMLGQRPSCTFPNKLH